MRRAILSLALLLAAPIAGAADDPCRQDALQGQTEASAACIEHLDLIVTIQQAAEPCRLEIPDELPKAEWKQQYDQCVLAAHHAVCGQDRCY